MAPLGLVAHRCSGDVHLGGLGEARPERPGGCRAVAWYRHRGDDFPVHLPESGGVLPRVRRGAHRRPVHRRRQPMASLGRDFQRGDPSAAALPQRGECGGVGCDTLGLAGAWPAGHRRQLRLRTFQRIRRRGSGLARSGPGRLAAAGLPPPDARRGPEGPCRLLDLRSARWRQVRRRQRVPPRARGIRDDALHLQRCQPGYPRQALFDAGMDRPEAGFHPNGVELCGDAELSEPGLCRHPSAGAGGAAALRQVHLLDRW